MPGIQIRHAVPADAPAVCAVLRRAIIESCVQDHQHDPATLGAWLGNKNPETVAGWFTAPSNFAVVADCDGAVAGVALLTQAGKLSLCYVLPELQGRGIGRLLLDGIEAQAQAWCITKIRLHSTSTASGFFAKRGYLLAGREKSCFGLETDFLWKSVGACETPAGGARKRFCNCSGG